MDPAAEVELKLKVSPEVKRLLDHLARHGLFGSSAEATAERLLAEKLRAVVLEGWVGTPGFSDGRTMPLVRVSG